MEEDERKPRQELLDELVALRQRVSALEAREAQRKTTETELREARQRLEYLLAFSPAIIYTTQASGDFACTFVSENLRAIMGYTPQEMTTDPKCWPARLHPDDAPRVFEEMSPLIERGGGTLEYRFQHQDGRYVWIQDTFKVTHDAAGHPVELVGAWADITERKTTETELREARQRLEYLLAVSPAIIYTTQASGDFACTFVSENLRAIMGYTPQEMTTDPKCWPARLHPDDAPRVFEEMSPLIERGGGTLEYRFQHQDGRYVWIQDTFKVTHDAAGHPLELVGAWADITERKRGRTGGPGCQHRAAGDEAVPHPSDRKLDRRHHLHGQARERRALQRGRRDFARLSVGRGRRPVGDADLRRTRSGQEKSCARCGSAGAPLRASRPPCGPRTAAAFRF